MRVFLSGKISDDPDYKAKFKKAQKALEAKGCVVLSPAILPLGFEYEAYMRICFAMLDECDAICLLPDWGESAGARREQMYANVSNKKIFYLNAKGETSLSFCVDDRAKKPK